MRRAENGGRALPASPGAPPPREAVGANRPGQKSETLLCSRKQRGGRGEERTDESPVEGEAGGGGRGGVIEDGIHSRFPVHRLAGSALR